MSLVDLELLTSVPPASYVTNEDGNHELKYLIEEIIDISDIESVLTLLDVSLEIPSLVSRAWVSLSLR